MLERLLDGLTKYMNKLAARRAERARQAAEEAALNKYGWIGQCPHCGSTLQTTKDSRYICETVMHWHYQCGACGGLAHFALWGPIPILDQEQGVKEFAKHVANQMPKEHLLALP